MTRRVFGPFNRVEGDLDLKVDISDGRVTEAWVNSPLFRGFEQILHAKAPLDALVYTPRICGICSVAQSLAAATALADCMQLAPARNGLLSSNLILACENAADHLTHFYLFFMPDFARAEYAARDWFNPTRERFAAQTGSASGSMLKARAEWLHLTGILAGKWPHSLAIQPGGSTRAIESHERIRMLAIIGAFREFLQLHLFGDQLEAIAAIDSAEALARWQGAHGGSDFAHFLRLADALELERLGRLSALQMSYGAYRDADGDGHAFVRGVRDKEGEPSPFDPAQIREDLSHSWMHSEQDPQHPCNGSTTPAINGDNGDEYSWCKAPRLAGQVVEVGALARQSVNAHPLITDLLQVEGASNVRNRVVARLLELALLVPLMEQWVRELRIGETCCTHGAIPDEASGAGMIEAARGSLGHWLRIRNGRIDNYQIIAPTTWNFSPRDQHGTPGALEQALVGTPVAEEASDSATLGHVVRSFDPCMVCTVH